MPPVTRVATLLGGALLALGGCSVKALDATGVRIDVTTDDPALRPWRYQLQWLDEDRRLLTATVPESGRLSEDPGASASIFIQLDPHQVGPRRVVARGLRDGALVSLGAVRVTALANKWTAVLLVTSQPSKVPDADGDEIPDVVDNCPATPDPCPHPDGETLSDGGDAPSDGGAPDGTVD
jgi:hypothetical protein